MRYRVTSSPAPDFKGVFRGAPATDNEGPALFGWFWPKEGIVIEVVDQAEDPEQIGLAPGVERLIGQRTMRALKEDPRIFIGMTDSAVQEADGGALAVARARIAELEATLKAPGGQAQGR